MFSRRKIDKELKTLSEHYSEDALAAMTKYGEIIMIPPGKVFFEEGKGGNEAAVIIEGTAKVTAAGEMVGVLKEGALIGESAMLTGEPRTASVQAGTLVKLVVLDPRAFSLTLNRCDAFRAKVNTSLEDRAA